MAGLINNLAGPQPDFQRMSQIQHEYYANEVGKIANTPQFQNGNAILAALTRLETRLDGIETRLGVTQIEDRG
jgi:hypothetical protein